MKQHLIFNTASFLTLLLIILPVLLFAQDPGGGPDTNAPIDGGLSILLAAGVAYGAKKVMDKRKKNNLDDKE